MSDRVCYIPTREDAAIAVKLGWNPETRKGDFNPHRVATLRGMYDTANQDAHIDVTDIEKAAEQIVKFRQDLKKNIAKEVQSVGTNLDKHLRQLKVNFTSEEQFNRVTMIASLFSQLVDNYQRMNPGVSRQQILEGYEENGRKKGGQMAIFDKVYELLLDRHSLYMAVPNGQGKEKADKIAKVLENWAALTTYVRVRLRDTEGIKLNNEVDTAGEVSSDNLDDNNLSELIDISESKREAWQEANDMKSAFGNVGAKVRSIISMLPRCTKDSNGNIIIERDDLGFEKFLDPVKTHQRLLDLLRGMSSSLDMMNMLKQNAENQVWLVPLIKYLEANPQAKTLFYKDFKKNFQKYSIIKRVKDAVKGVREYKTLVLNRVYDKLGTAFNLRISGIPIGDGSVYDINGNVNWNNLRKVRQNIIDWLGIEEQQQDQNTGIFRTARVYGTGRNVNKYFSPGGTSLMRRDFIVNTSRALGIDMDADTAESLMRNRKDLNNYLKNLYDLVQYGIDPALGTANLNSMLTGAQMPNMQYRNLIKNSGNLIKSREKIDKMNTLITKHREGLRVDSRVLRKDSNGNSVSLFSNVNPCYMGDKLEAIRRYIDTDDKRGLKQFLEQHYLSSSYFMDNGEIRNRWIKDLYEACNSKEPLSSLGELFDYQRFLGTPDLNFEDFTSKQHAIDMIQEYFAPSQLSQSDDTALYPVFILGDSGVAKYIRQKRYSQEEIVEGLWQVYQQERKRMQAVAAVNKQLDDLGKRQNGYYRQNSDGTTTYVEGEGYSKVANFSATENKFTLLPFLNEEKYKVGKDASEEEVKKVITNYLEDAYRDFKKKLNEFGVFEQIEVTERVGNKTQKVNKFVYLNKIMEGQDPNILMRDFFLNVKFATIQQMQLFTIDTAFYKGTKDLQKRYKEIHAPGTVLDIYAVDDNKQRYSQDGIETCMYFEDIEINTEETDAEFMEVMARVHGKDSPTYKKYKESSLTDGQGYRTLTGYRKVMGMAGEWTPEMEAAYNQIMEIRRTYGKGTIPQAELDKIEKMAVIFKPIKPYMFTHEKLALNNNDCQIIPVQHKYAEAVLIPELLPMDSKLRAIAYYMDEHKDKKGNPQPIDMIGSTTICKVGSFGTAKINNLTQYDDEISDKLRKDKTEITNEERINHALSKGYVHQLSYEDYRIQTNVPDHVYHSQLFGTQVRKLIMAGVLKYDKQGNIIDPVDSKGHYLYEKYVGNHKVNLCGNMVRLNGRNLMAFYNSLIVANELESYEKFEKAVRDKNEISKRLTQGVIGNSKEAIDNLLSFSLDENGDFVMPLFEGSLEHDTSSMLLSMFKKMVNKQTINGGSGVQVSAMGIKDYSEDGGLHYVYEYDKDGNPVNILYAECEIPFNFKYTDDKGNTVELNYEDYCNEDGTLKSDADGQPLIEKKFPGITNMIAYRIPTERAYSMLNLKVVRFSRKTTGGTIKVPAQGTTISGFDFDIDKLYFMRREYIAAKGQKLKEGEIPSKWEKYEYEKTALENTRAARNNMLIDLIQQRLMDKETLPQRVTPGGFVGASKSARIMRELQFGDIKNFMHNGVIDWQLLDKKAEDKKSDPEPNYDPSDPITIITYNQQNQIAGKLIGVFANHNTNHALAGLMKTFRLADGQEIPLAGHTKAEGYGFDLLNGPEGVDTELTMAEFLAASVDAVKDPVLNFLNFNTLTADSGALLARLGYNTLEIGMLFNQPIIKEVCEYAFNNSMRLEEAVKDVTSKYKTTFGVQKIQFNQDSISLVTLDNLAKNILDFREQPKRMNDKNFAIDQLQILMLFNHIATVASEVSSFVSSTKFTASNAVSSNFGDMYAQQMKVENYIKATKSEGSSLVIEVTDMPYPVSTPMQNGTDRLKMSKEEYAKDVMYNPLGYEQAMYDINRKAIRLLGKYFPYETPVYREARAFLRNLTKGKYLDGDTINSVHRDLMVYLLSQQERSDFNGDILRSTRYGDMPIREYFLNHFAKDLFDELQTNPELKAMSLFEYMIPEVDEEGNMSMVIQGIGGLAPYQKDAIRDSWVELNRKYPDISRDLFLYNFYKLGFDFSPISFMNLAPTEVKQSIKVPSEDNPDRTYVDFLKEVMQGKFGINRNDFAIQYILNHTDNYRLVKKAVNEGAKRVINPLIYKAGEAQSRFTLDLTDRKNSEAIKNNFILSVDERKGISRWIPAIVVGDNVFIANGTGDTAIFNESDIPSMEYVKVQKMGDKKSKSYTSSINLQYVQPTPMQQNEAPIEAPEVIETLAPTPETEPATPEPTIVEETSSIEAGNSSIKADEAQAPVNTTFNREQVVNDIVEELHKTNFWGAGLTKEELRAMIGNDANTDEALQGTIDEIRESIAKHGKLMLDAEGNPVC